MTHKKTPTINRLADYRSDTNAPSYSFVFSDNIEDWRKSSKSKMATIARDYARKRKT